MNETDRKEKEQEELMLKYVAQLRSWSNSQLCEALIYFLTKDLTSGKNFSSEENNLIKKRKLFILKVLKEYTQAGRFQVAIVPDEIEEKLVAAYIVEKKKEEDEKQAHVAELMEEMDEIF